MPNPPSAECIVQDAAALNAFLVRAFPGGDEADRAKVILVEPGRVRVVRPYDPRSLRPGGVIALDNMLYSGEVAAARPSGNAAALAALNAKIHGDSRVDMALASIGDGLMLARKR